MGQASSLWIFKLVHNIGRNEVISLRWEVIIDEKVIKFGVMYNEFHFIACKTYF